jgi:hypothetical protein
MDTRSECSLIDHPSLNIIKSHPHHDRAITPTAGNHGTDGGATTTDEHGD